MYRPLYSDKVFKFPAEETLQSKFVEVNLASAARNGDLLGGLKKAGEENTVGLDSFSNALLMKSEMNLVSDSSPFDEMFATDTMRKSASSDDIDKNASSISFFRDLKDYFNRSLLDKLRTYVKEIFVSDVAHFNLPETDCITVTHDEFRERAILLKREMASTEVSIVQIYMALKERYRVVESANVPSIGSLLHPYGACKPCVFANKKSNYCKSGFDCNFCHYNHKLSKSKSASKISFSKLSSQTEFFNRLIRTPRSDSTTIRNMPTDDGFSITSSSGSIHSLAELRSSVAEDVHTFSHMSAEPLIVGARPKPMLRL